MTFCAYVNVEAFRHRSDTHLTSLDRAMATFGVLVGDVAGG